MKLIIEKLENKQYKRTLEFKGKEYSEIWEHDDRMVLRTINGCIEQDMEDDNVPAEGTDIEDFLTSVCMSDFISLDERERYW